MRALLVTLLGLKASRRIINSDDWEFIEQMHLARRIYKPRDVEITLAQYAALTRTFAGMLPVLLPFAIPIYVHAPTIISRRLFAACDGVMV